MAKTAWLELEKKIRFGFKYATSQQQPCTLKLLGGLSDAIPRKIIHSF